jgi:hypothetical protein
VAEVTLTLEEYDALRSLISSERESEGAELAAAEKKPRKASAYSKRYGKAFKKLSPDFKKMNGEWKKNGFRSAVRAAHKLAGSNRKL